MSDPEARRDELIEAAGFIKKIVTKELEVKSDHHSLLNFLEMRIRHLRHDDPLYLVAYAFFLLYTEPPVYSFEGITPESLSDIMELGNPNLAIDIIDALIQQNLIGGIESTFYKREEIPIPKGMVFPIEEYADQFSTWHAKPLSQGTFAPNEGDGPDRTITVFMHRSDSHTVAAPPQAGNTLLRRLMRLRWLRRILIGPQPPKSTWIPGTTFYERAINDTTNDINYVLNLLGPPPEPSLVDMLTPTPSPAGIS